MRKISIFLILILLFSFINQSAFIGSVDMSKLTGMNTVFADVKVDNLTLTSKSAILMSADSGEILYEKNSNSFYLTEHFDRNCLIKICDYNSNISILNKKK